jgi:aspartyl-tRNA(Asn)/glutamyl-tRNA(Gln) amidotransferase subunit C
MHGVALTEADVRYVAELARLALSDDEQARMLHQLSSILESMEILNEVDTSAIPPTAQVIEARTVMRPDVVRPSLPREVALRNAPASEEGYFRVDAVLDVE